MGFLAQIREHPSRLLTTVLLLPCMFSTGLSVAMVGPTLLDLQQQTGTTLTQISLALTARSAGAGIGAMISEYDMSMTRNDEIVTLIMSDLTVGFVYPKVNFLLSASIAMMAAALFSYLMGMADNLWMILVVALINWGCFGFFEGGLQVFLLQMWGKEAMPFIQVAYFLLGSGCLVAPLVAEPFLTDRDADLDDGLDIKHQQSKPLRVLYAFGIMSASLVFCSGSAFVAWWRAPEMSEHPSRQVTSSNHAPGSTDQKRTSAWKIVIVILHLIFVHVYAGIEIGMGSFLLTFAAKSDMHLSKTTGSYLTTMFWTTFTFMKLGALLIIPFIGNGNNILLGVGITAVGSGILVPYGSHDETMLWIGVGLVGIGLSSIYACTFRYLEGFFPVSSVIAALTSSAFIAGEFTFPFIISGFIERQPQVLMWMVMCCTIAMIVTYPVIMFLCHYKLKR